MGQSEDHAQHHFKSIPDLRDKSVVRIACGKAFTVAVVRPPNQPGEVWGCGKAPFLGLFGCFAAVMAKMCVLNWREIVTAYTYQSTRLTS